jgi:hypothetical protein
MDRSRKNKRIAFWFFLPSSIAMAYFLFNLASFAAEQPEAQPKAGHATYRIIPASPDRVILTKGIPRTIDKVRLTYLGMDDDSVVIDVTILDLDPDYAYRRMIPKQRAELGFSLAQQRYRLISAGNFRLKIARTKG